MQSILEAITDDLHTMSSVPILYRVRSVHTCIIIGEIKLLDDICKLYC